MQEDWCKERVLLLKSISEKEERVQDFKNRILPTTIEDERLVIKEKNLKEEVKAILSKIDTVKKEIEVLELKKKLKLLEEEHASLMSS